MTHTEIGNNIPEEQLLDKAKSDGIKKICIGVGIKKDSSVLLVRRHPDDFLGGFWEFPGGGVESGESLQETLLREVFEETGVAISKILGMFDGWDYSSESGSITRQFNFIVETESDAIVLAPKEHDQFAWVSQEQIKDFELTPEVQRSLLSFFANL